MKYINNYIVTKKIKELNTFLNLWLCCDNEGDSVEILTIVQDSTNQKLLNRVIANEVKPLVHRDVSGFQKVLETGFDAENQCHFIVYEHLVNYKPFADHPKNATIHSVKEIAKGLDLLKKENRQNHLIALSYLQINAEGSAKLRFIGLFEVFKQQHILDKNYLAPNVQEWLNDSKNLSPNFQDDLFSLVKSFENIFTAETSAVKGEILEKALAPERIERFSKYHELLDLLEEIPSIQQNFNETTKRTIQLKTDTPNKSAFQKIIDDMNVDTWFSVEHELSKGKISGAFSSNNWNGVFVLNTEGSLFIPFSRCRNEKNSRLLKHPDSFLGHFTFSTYSSNYKCYPFFQEKFDTQNKLAELSNAKTNLIKLWQTLPDKEREYIEENAFKARYKSREPCQHNSSNIKFVLTGVTDENWLKLKELKNQQVILFIEEQKIGRILDYNPKENVITIKDAFCTVDEIAEKGELIEDVRQETGQFKKQVEACKKFEKLDIVNPLLCSILATSDIAAMPNSAKIYEEDYLNFAEGLYNKNLKHDETQRDTVLEALHKKTVFLIQGPPGTGKTTVIVELIRQLIKKQSDVKILVTSQSNLAVDNVLEKLAAINSQEAADLKFMRLASHNALEKDNISKEIIPHTFENKLKNWVSETEKASNDYFSSKFTEELGEEFLILQALQRDWFSFLGGVTVDDGKNRKQSMLNNGSTEIDFLTAMMLQTNVIGATCIHIASSQYHKINFRFDYVIMDESSKANPAETLVPINMGQNIILIGDHKQLPPVITREDAVKTKIKSELEDNGLGFEKDFGESLFERLVKTFEQDEQKQQYIKMLDVQYRMPKQIGTLISNYFYDGKLKNVAEGIIPDYDQEKHHGLKLKKETSIVFFSTSQRENPSDNDNKFNRQNNCNVEAIKELLEKLNQLYADNLNKSNPFTIGIIAGYRGQVELLKKSINLSDYSNFLTKEISENGDEKMVNLIEINTVDKFQGAERDIIIYDVVRSSKGQSNIGFLDDYRRINVAFSRAKRFLIIVGDSDYLIHRATLNSDAKFKEFKLQQITQELQDNGLVVNTLNEIFE